MNSNNKIDRGHVVLVNLQAWVAHLQVEIRDASIRELTPKTVTEASKAVKEIVYWMAELEKVQV